jgi:hypothetical protein
LIFRKFAVNPAVLHLKKIPAIMFLLVFLYSAIGYYPAFVISRYKIRNDFKQKIKKDIPEAEIASITLTDEVLNKLKWNADDEFELDGQMYDIISKEKDKQGLTVFRCHPDSKEKKLYDNFFHWIKTTHDEENNTNDNTNVLTYFSLDYLAPSGLSHDYFSEMKMQYYPEGSSYKSYCPENPSPPPEMV